MSVPRTIPPDEVEVDPTSYVDPSGRLFSWREGLYRGILPARKSFFDSLLATVAFSRLQERGAVVGTEATDLELEGYPLVLSHRTIYPRSYCVEWAPEMLQDAGILTLEVCLELLKADAVLVDAYPWNVLFDGPRPVFVDVGSMQPADQEAAALWPPYGQFCNFFLFPLYLYACNLHEVARRALYDYLHGVSYELCSRLLPRTFKLTRPQVISRLEMPRLMSGWVKKLGLEDKMRSAARDLDGKVDPKPARERFLKGLLRDVKRIRLRLPDTTWSDYYEEWPPWDSDAEWNPKQKVIRDLLERHKPDSVLDVACNRGWYSILAARSGARVVAFDNDEGCVSRLYREVREKDLPITPLVVDLLNPAPRFGWKLQQFPSLLDRIEADMVLALALIHHLVISQWQNFDRVIELLGCFCRKTLVLEFVPLDDEKSQTILKHFRRESFDWYTLENLEQAALRHFSSCEVLDSFPKGRQLLVCLR